ncbi:MAG: tRNA (adenosine(37)-N6)-threonylcarbamoyltransferase complex ATPase subunit type 1 TsaE [Anaerohalosphaeraceae bacterium]|nr:tRNA (adenosine(37)-N6)-threonylcarbamoyltransferase complex ATPase subunit type 1 TsaE [Anaerohalosphaeraceae bacterium]
MQSKTIEFISNSVDETIRLGRKIGATLKGGEVICLDGNLSSGKTHLAKGIASGLGADGDSVNSPTFVMVNEYHCKFDVYHIDAYRAESVAEFEALGFAEFIGPSAVVLIEWANKILPALESLDCIRIELEHKGQNVRLIKITGDLSL